MERALPIRLQKVKSGDNRFPCPGFISGASDFAVQVSYNVSSTSNKSIC